MPSRRNVTIGYAWPNLEDSVEFGMGRGDLWMMLTDISSFLKIIIADKVDFEDNKDKYSDAEILAVQKDIATSLESLINRRRSGNDETNQSIIVEKRDLITSESDVVDLNTGKDIDDLFKDLENSPKEAPIYQSDNFISLVDKAEISEDVKKIDLTERVAHILETKPWAEAISESAAEILIDTARKIKFNKQYAYSDAIKVLMVLFHAAGFKFIDPKTNDIARNFFEILFQADLVRSAPWLRTSPAKPFSSMSSNHADLMIRLHYTQSGSSREVTAYGLSEEGYIQFRSDIIKMGIWKFEIEKIEDLVKGVIRIPSSYPEALQVDTEKAMLQIID